jgi:hypothetical protein
MLLVTRARVVAVMSFLFLAGCWGEVNDAQPSPPLQESPPSDVSDPRFLPAGLYLASVGEVSCDVNQWFQPFPDVPLFVSRGDGGVNLQLPIRTSPADGSMALPRQDIHFAKPEQASSRRDEKWCPDGEVTRSLVTTDLEPHRIGLTYRQELRGCPAELAPTCTIAFAFTLANAACLPPDDPACEPIVNFELSSGFHQRLSCTCDTR